MTWSTPNAVAALIQFLLFAVGVGGAYLMIGGYLTRTWWVALVGFAVLAAALVTASGLK